MMYFAEAKYLLLSLQQQPLHRLYKDKESGSHKNSDCGQWTQVYLKVLTIAENNVFQNHLMQPTATWSGQEPKYFHVCKHRIKKKKILIISTEKRHWDVLVSETKTFSLALTFSVVGVSRTNPAKRSGNENDVINVGHVVTQELGAITVSLFHTCGHGLNEKMSNNIFCQVIEWFTLKHKMNHVKLSSHLTNVWSMEMGNCMTWTNSCRTEVSCPFKVIQNRDLFKTQMTSCNYENSYLCLTEPTNKSLPICL